MKGSELNAYGIYGTQGVPNVANKPGSRWGAMSWSSPSSDFWLFGGSGYAETTGPGEMNDLWNINSISVLPIKLISFTGTREQGKIQLQWRAEDVNSSNFFIVERSLNGMSFNLADTVAATPLQKNYVFNDNPTLNTKTVFYRIKVAEQGNRFFYSKILSFTLPNNNLLTIYPNPAKTHIWFRLFEGEMINASYSVIDVSGRTSLHGNFVTTASNRNSIDVSKLSPGNYIVSIKTKKGTKQASFIKQ